MNKIRSRSLIGSALFAAAAIVLAGCETVAVAPRGHVDGDRPRDARTGRLDGSTAMREASGTVQRVDESRREIHLRTAGRGPDVFRYDRNTVVRDRGRDLSVDDLRRGDEVAVRWAGRAGDGRDVYADAIRVLDRSSDGRSRW